MAETTTIRVVNVRGLRTPEQRAGIVYVGRAFAGWPRHPLGNPYRPTDAKYDYAANRLERCIDDYRLWIERHPRIDSLMAGLWEACEHGAKPLGCWCITATHGDGQPVVCHGQILGEMLHRRFVQEGGA